MNTTAIGTRRQRPRGLGEASLPSRCRTVTRGNAEGDSEWAWLAIVVAGLSVFAQVNPILDIVITVAYFVSAVWLFRRDEFVVIYAILAIFAPRLYLYSGGVSTASVFLLIYVARMLVTPKAGSINMSAGIAVAFIALHGVLAVFPAKGAMVFLNYAATCAVAVSLLVRLRDLELFRKFMVAWMIGAVAASLYALVNPNALSAASSELAPQGFVRFNGVLSDPNYMGLILVLGLVGAQLLSHHLVAIRVACSITLLAFVTQTGSLTALLALAIGAIVYSISGRETSKLGLFVVTLAAIVTGGTIWGSIYSRLANLETFSFLSDRIVHEISMLEGADLTSLGSGRVGIAEQYLGYFWEQDLLAKLFGGNVVGNYGLSDAFASSLGSRAMPHNFHIELLMTVGLLGWLAFALAAAIASAATVAGVLRSGSRSLRALAAAKSILLVYSFSLSMFPTWWILVLLLLAPTSAPGQRKRTASAVR